MFKLNSLFTGPFSALSNLGRREAGILLLVGAVGIGWSAHEIIERTIGTVESRLENQGSQLAQQGIRIDSLEVRTDAVEEWQEEHDRTVTNIVSESAVNNEALREDLGVMREMIHQLYCDRWPERCEGVPTGSEG